MRMTRKIRRAWLRGKPEWAKCYLLKQRQRKQAKVLEFNKPQTRLHNYSRYLVAGVMLACLGMGQSVACASEITASSGVTNNVIKDGNVYNIYNQTVNSHGSALNKFDNFNLTSGDIANMQLDAHTVNGVNYSAADRQINLVSNKVVIDGVLNAFKDGKIGGDVYFFSDKGIAVGANGVINVGSLTLGTSTAAGQSIYDDWGTYSNKTPLERAKYIITGSSDVEENNLISVNGVINSTGDVVIGANKVVVGDAAQINTGATFNGTYNSNLETVDEYKAQFMNLNGIDKATTAIKTADGDVVLFGASTVEFKGDAYTAGGDFAVISENTEDFFGSSTKDISIDNAKVVTNGGDIDIAATYASEGRDIDIDVIHKREDSTTVNITNAELDATDKTDSSTADGDVNVAASTIKETLSWSMTGSVATVNIIDSTLTGDNVSVGALASTVGKLDADSVNCSDEEIEAAIEESDHEFLKGIKDIAIDTGSELRTLLTYTDVHANSIVNILDSEIHAVGGSNGDGNTTHGDINVNALAASEVTTMGIGLLAFSATAGISDVNAQINIGSKENSDMGSTLDAANDVILNAKGSNKVDLYYLDMALIDTLTYSGAATNWAEVNSDVKINVDGNSKIKASDDVSITAESIRTLINYACSGGDADYLGVTTTISLADTNAEVIVNGDIYTDGDVNVSAKNSVAEEDGYYIADTSIAESMSGDTFMGKSVSVGLKKSISGLVGKITRGKHHFVNVESVPSKGKLFGMNAATAVLSSYNTAKTEVNGIVKNKAGDGAANSLSVTAENISRSNVVSMAYQNELTKVSDGSIVNNKDYGVASGVNVGVQKNSATASVNGDVNVVGDLVVKAETKVPWESASWGTDDATVFGTTTNFIINLFTSRNAGMSDLVDSWAQSNNSTDKAAMAASIGVMEYNNESTAYIGENATLTVDGKLDVSALNEIVTANFAGNISSPVNMMPLGALWKYTWGYNKDILKPDAWGTNSEYASSGGSAVAVHQANKANAYVADGAMINSAENIEVTADNRAANAVITAAGGKSDGVTLDATIGVTRTENSAHAYIGKATVNSANDVKVTAKDQAIIANIGGAIDESGGTVGIGGTVAYNHIERDTRAYSLGNVTAGNSVIIDAKNTGEIVAASIAGSVTMKSTAGNAAGSSGLHATDSEDGEESLTKTVGEFLNTNVTENSSKKKIDVDTGENAIANASNNGQGANATKSGFAVAANVAVNRITDNAEAFIDRKANATNDSSVTADYVRVTSENDSEIASAALSAALDFSTGKASTGIAGSFMYNGITSANNAYVKNATLTLTGNSDANKDEALTITAQNAERIFNLAGSGSIAPKGNSVVGQISVNVIDNTNNAYLQNGIVRTAEKVSVIADDSAKIESFTGAMSLTGGSFAIGAAIGVQDIDTATTAKISNSEIAGLATNNNTAYDKGGAVDVTAQEQSEVTSIIAAGSIGVNTAMVAEAAVSVSDVDTTTKAYIDSGENIKMAAINIAAKNLANATVGVGQIGVGKNAFGAASATMLSTNAVEAYLTGDAAQEKVIQADSINVEAENLLNGFAEDLPDDDDELTDEQVEKFTTSKIVAVGGAVGTGAAAGAGSVTVNIIDNTTKAHVDAGKYLVDNGINVNADSKAYMFGLAGGVSVGKAAGVGAAVDTQMLDALTEAYITDNVIICKAGDVTVKASSIEKITSVAAIASGGSNFAGAAAANAHDIDVETKAYIGSDNAANETVLGEGSNKVGNIQVTATDTSDVSSNACSGSVEIGSGGAALSGSAAVEFLNKTVIASVGKTDINANGLQVTANNTGSVLTTANGIAIAITEAGAGLTGSASESIVKYVTDAHIADSSTVDVNEDVIVDADSSFEHIGVATALAGSSWVGVGLSNDTTVLDMVTNAYLGDSAIITAADDVSITADSLVDITSAVASGGAAIAAANGGVGVNVIDTKTKAFVGSGSTVTANNNTTDALKGIKVHAQDDTILEGGSGGAAIGGVGAGASVNVNDIDKETLAYVGSGSTLNTKGATDIEAISNEKIFNVTAQGSGGLFAGLAGAVAVHDLDVITKAYTDSNVKINQDAEYGTAGNVTFNADHNLGINSCVVGGSLGVGAVGAAVDVANVITQTNAYIGDGGEVTTAGELTVVADETVGDFQYTNENNETVPAEMKSTVVATAIGLGSIGGSVSVYNFGSGMSEADKDLLNAADADGNTQSFDAWLGEQINQSNTAKAMAAYESNAVAESVGTAINERNFDTTVVTNASTIGEAGIAAKLGKNVEVKAASVDVDANSNVKMDVNAGTGSSGSVAAGASVGIVHNNSKISSIVDSRASITASGGFDLQAKGETTLDGMAVSPAVGFVAGSAAALDLNSATDVTTKINENVAIEAQSIAVNALNTPKLNAYATGVGVGIAGVGTVEALVSSNDDAYVLIGNGATLKATGTSSNEGEVEILAATQKADTYNAYVKAEAGSGGVLNGSVTVSQIDLDNETKVTIGQNVNISGKKVDVQAKHEDAFNYENISAGAGGFSGLGSDNRVNVISDVAISIGSSGEKTRITSSEATNIKAENITTKDWLKATSDAAVGEADYNALSAGASLAGGSGIVNETKINHTTDATLENVAIKANAIPLTSEEASEGIKLTDKNAIAIDAHSQITSKDYQYIGTGVVIEAAHIDDENKVKADTSVNIGATTELEAGKIDVADTSAKITTNGLINGTYDASEVGGGKIAIGVKNDADIYSKTIVNTWGAAGYAGTNNNVNYDNTVTANIDGKLETANGDISLNVGSDSANAVGNINVNADSRLLNSTLIPISVEPDPIVVVDSASKLNVGSTAKLLSDRDVYLKASAGNATALGYGEIKDWAHALADDIGAKNSITGSEDVKTSADVQIDGYVETGIHRNQSIVIDGTAVDEDVNSTDGTYKKVWITDVEHTSGIGFEYQDNVAIVSAYKQRLEELRDLCSLYSADEGAVAAYEAEMKLIMDKMVENGFAYYETFTENGKTKTAFVMFKDETLLTNEVIIQDTQVRLGNIVVEADNLYGNGILNAGADADVKIINKSPNNLVVNDIFISSDCEGTVNSLYNGGYIIYNNANVSDVGDIAGRNDGIVPEFSAITSKANSSEQPVLEISNTYNPSSHTVSDGVGNVVKYFAAPSLTVAEGAEIYNPKGNVVIKSDYGDVNNKGIINAGSVSVQATNGDYTQTAGDRIVDIGGSPVGFEDKFDENYGNGILANGNVYISARYINITSEIRSGVGYKGWSIIIPEEPTFYKDNDTNSKYTIAQIDAMTDKENAAFTLANGSADTFADSACGQVTYDHKSKHIVIDGIETNGGSVELVGTILNTVHSSSDMGKISVLDGSSKVNIVNNSNIALELRNISTGENVEGVIKITDLDFLTGEKTRTTTYTRKDGAITTNVETYNSAGHKVTSTVNSSQTTYEPEELYYVWQKAYDSTTETEYHYSDSKPVIWWEDGDFSGATGTHTVVSTTTSAEKLVEPGGTYITNTHEPNPGNGVTVGNAHVDDGYYQYVYTITTSSEKYDERTETNRLWYTLGIVKEYDHWYKVRDGQTTVTHTAIDASRPVTIAFIGSENGGDFDVTSNGSDVYVNGNIKNIGGSADISAQNIYQGRNGFIDTGNLGLVASGSIGTAGEMLLTNAAELDNIQARSSVYIYDTNDKVDLSIGLGDSAAIVAGDVVSIIAAGDIVSVQTSPLGLSTNIRANRIELTSENGSIKDLAVRVGNAEKTSAYGLKVSAAGDIDIANRSGDLYLDSVISKNGDVHLTTNGSFIDNNFTDVVEDDVKKVIESYKNAQVLENQGTTTNLQKNMLINAAQTKYNRYQALKKCISNGKYTLSEVDMAALQKLGYTAEQISAIIAERQAEFDELKAFGADGWDEQALEAYKTNLEASNSSLYANANLQAQDVNADTFLTANERATVLVGSARKDGEMVVGVSNSVFRDVTDTTFTKKAVPNVKGKQVRLTVRGVAGNIGSTESIDTTIIKLQDILQKDLSNNEVLTAEEKMLLKALHSAGYDDIAIDDSGYISIKVVDALVVEADDLKIRGLNVDYQGQTYGEGKVNNIFVNSEKTIAFNTLNTNGDVYLKSDESINGRAINTNGNVVLEGSNGTIGYNDGGVLKALMLSSNSQKVTARAKGDIHLGKNGVLVEGVIYSKDGEILLATDGLITGNNTLHGVKLYNPKNVIAKSLYRDNIVSQDAEEQVDEESNAKDANITFVEVTADEEFITI